MGADLISYIVIVPKKLDESRKEAAVKQIERLLADPEFQTAQYEDHEDLVSAFEGPAKDLVDNLFEICTSGARDVNDRYVSNEDQRKILVAGELSWGDEPDGFGYQTLKWASIFGLFPLFDIT